MKKTGIILLVILGSSTLGIALANAAQAPSIAYLVGSLAPGVVCWGSAVYLQRNDQQTPLSLSLLVVLGISVAFLSAGVRRFLLPNVFEEDEKTAWTYHSAEHGFT